MRRPGFDSYWRYREAFLGLLPPASRETLDQGCSEGRVSRDLAQHGHRATGVDTSPALVAAARDADPSSRYLVADAARLPFDNDSFDLVVSYNMLMDTTDVTGVVGEARRMLAPGGRLCLSITPL